MSGGNEKFERDFESFLSDDDSRLAALYRKLPQAEPDARLDAAVRAHAHRTVAATVTARTPAQRRWMPAIGIAAVLALAAGIGLRLAPQLWQRPLPAPPAAPAAAPAEPAPAPIAPVAQDMAEKLSVSAIPAKEAAAEKPATQAAREQEPESQRLEDTAPPPMPQAFPAPAPASKSLLKQAPAAAPQAAALAPAPPVPAASTAEETAAQSAGAVAMPETRRAAKAMSAVPAETGAQASDANASLYPEHWLANIRQMLRDNRRDEALRSLDLFRKKYPDYHLPDDLRDLH